MEKHLSGQAAALRVIGAGIGVAALLGAVRLFASLAPDIQRYDRMRAMSGDLPLAQMLPGELRKLIVKSWMSQAKRRAG